MKLFNLMQQLQKMYQLLEVSHVSKRSSSLRISIPKKVAEAMELKDGDIIGFYECNGEIVLRRLK